MADPTLRQFRAFKLIVEEGSFGRAAQRLGISQSAISKHVTTLENKLGFRLFKRKNGAKSELTERGGLVLKDVASFLGTADTIAAFGRYAGQQRKSIRISAGAYIAKCVIVPNLGRLHLQRPDLTVELTMLDSPLRAFEPAQRDAADLTYVSVPDPQLAESAELICIGQSVFAASPSLPVVKQLARGKSARLPMIMGVPGEHADRMVRLSLANAKLTNYYTAHVAQLPEVMISLAIAGEGVCCSFPGLIRRELASGALQILDLPSMSVYVCALYNSKKLTEGTRYIDEFFRPLIRASM
jgi:DNA-binding transcriptional LysR family regulator